MLVSSDLPITQSSLMTFSGLQSWKTWCHLWPTILQRRFHKRLGLSLLRNVSHVSLTLDIITDSVVVYDDLTHPPATFIGPKHQFRTADGSNNNPAFPDLGKAGTPYARSVQRSNPFPQNQMPDSGLVFDTLLRREKVCMHQHLLRPLT